MTGPNSPVPFVIHDVLLTPLPAAQDGRRAILGFEDHLLRRFGSAELIRLSPGESFFVLRAMADEVWVLLDGAAEFELSDKRPISPTGGASQSLRIDSSARLLLPFGVRLRVRPDPAVSLLRFMSHSEREDPSLPSDV
jgi:hypothetical protein